ncbi:Threonine/homoserine efflux transporter RhtA [Granulicatella balaenopterae]|uniref:Threonine/homoserine efflux transporter RhtA n=1 Tax=Granulicatella balaenopterae TaxID=137733 RepID=A0A1H9JHN7_9LACT|nr:DMT family transporter [Granulicatella balaenopterae]SEQ86307.1 Threonine/homoserine efflux transporter RhtA [Granulicatella balaenopterae]
MQNTNKNTMKGLGLVLIATFFWATMGITSQNLNSAHLSSIQVAFTRCLQAAIFTTIALGIKNRNAFKVDWKGLLFCAFYGIVGFGFAFAFFSLTVERLPIAVATVLMFSNPIWVTLFGKLFFNDYVGLKKIITISTCVFGCMLIINIFAPGNSNLNIFGVILGLLSGITFASQLVIPRFANGKYSNDTLLLYGFWAATIFLGFFSDIPNLNYSIIHAADPTYVILNLLAIGFLSTYIANSYYIKSTEFIGTTLPSILVAFEPIFAAILAFFVLGETITGIQILGAALVVVSVVVMQVDEVPAFLKKFTSKKSISTDK